MKRRVFPALAVVLLAAAVVFCVLWRTTAQDRSDLKNMAQAEAKEAYASFLRFQEEGNEEDYWDGAAAFRAFQDAYGLLTENTNKSVNHSFCSQVYGDLISSPEKSKAHILELIAVMKILSENIMDENGYAAMLELRNALQYEK